LGINIKQAGSAEVLRQRVEAQVRKELAQGGLQEFCTVYNLPQRIAHLDKIAEMSRNKNRTAQTRIAAVITGLRMAGFTDKA